MQPFGPDDAFTAHHEWTDVAKRKRDRQKHASRRQRREPCKDSDQEWLLHLVCDIAHRAEGVMVDRAVVVAAISTLATAPTAAFLALSAERPIHEDKRDSFSRDGESNRPR